MLGLVVAVLLVFAITDASSRGQTNQVTTYLIYIYIYKRYV